MSDNDQALEALLKILTPNGGYSVPYVKDASAILDAIRKSEVPGVCMAEPLDALQQSVERLEDITALRAEVERLKMGYHESCFARIEAEKARADKAEYERDVANGFIRDRAAERDRLALEVAELRRAQHVSDSSAINMAAHQAEQQRDRLAGLVDRLVSRHRIHGANPDYELIREAEAALAEVGK